MTAEGTPNNSERLIRIEKSLDLAHEKLDRMNVDFRVHEKDSTAHGIDKVGDAVSGIRRRMAYYAGATAAVVLGINIGLSKGWF